MLPFLRSKLPSFPAPVWAVLAGALVNRIGTFVVPFLALYFTQQLHYSPTKAGVLVSLFGVGAMLAGPTGGVLSDRIGYHRALPLSLVLGAGAMLNLGLAHGDTHVAAAVFFVGWMGELYRPAVNAAIAHMVPPEKRTEAYSLLYWFINLGFSAAMLLAGTLTRVGFLLLFVVDAATTLAYSAVVFVALRRVRRDASEGQRLDYARPLRDIAFLSVVAVGLMVAMVFMQHATTLPLSMVGAGLSTETFGRLVAINGILIVVFQPFLGRLVQRLPWWLALLISDLLIGIGFFLTTYARVPWQFAVTVVVWTFGEILMAPVYPAVVSSFAPPSLRGTYQGVMQLSWGAASFAGPALGMYVLDRYHQTTLWRACLATGVVAAALHALLGLWSSRRSRMQTDSH